MRKRGIVFGVLMVLVAVTIVSATLGREIYGGRRPGLLSFGIIHFAGYLFFLLMPVEALVPYYQSEGHSGPLLVLIACGTAILAQLIDYGIGSALSRRILPRLKQSRRYARAQAAIDRHGRWAVLVFNLLPLSSPNLLLAAGIVRFPLPTAVLFSATGLLGKYLAMVYLFGLF